MNKSILEIGRGKVSLQNLKLQSPPNINIVTSNLQNSGSQIDNDRTVNDKKTNTFIIKCH
jgi:hypothetical protein